MATAESLDGDAIMRYSMSNIILSLGYFVLFVFVGDFLPMPEEQLHQQNHSSVTEAENFPIVLQ